MPLCRECRKFFTVKGKCEKSKGLKRKACDQFAAGRPFQPKFSGKKLSEVKFDPKKNQAWSFWINDTDVLVLAWQVDHNDYGHFRTYMMALDDQGVITKQFTAKQSAPAFAGEVVVKGPGQNDVWASFGFEDRDIQDSEGNVTNKPREVKIYPRRRDV